jgi:pSer/pThr/pTyr-binding forkhead associated (FHA) protein
LDQAYEFPPQPDVASANPLSGGGPVTAVLHDTTTGDNYPLTSTLTRIGRKPDNDIVLADRTVTGHHAAIVATPTGYLIEGQRYNVVLVDGERIGATATLTDGAVIGIGGRELIFEIRDEADR